LSLLAGIAWSQRPKQKLPGKLPPRKAVEGQPPRKTVEKKPPIAVEPAVEQAVRESGEAQWIWTPPRERPSPQGVSFFRKTFTVREPVDGVVEIACDNRYELFVNGRRIGAGSNWRVLDRHDIRRNLVSGRNVVAVRGEKQDARSRAGLVARVIVRGAGGTYVSHSTDATWRCTEAETPQWNGVRLNDTSWGPARSLGELGVTPPWNDQVRPADGSTAGRFRLPPNFQVERVVAPKQCGSLVAMAFDEWGNILAAREGEKLLLIEDRDENGTWETVVPLSNKLKNCQGLVPINREVFAIGDGADGAGLYRLTDEDGDGACESAAALVKFAGGMGEHGPHAVTLGPDGWLYMVVGNHAKLESKSASSSPYRNYYEGDLIQPRYEDAGGHAVGIKAPGGTVLRMTLDGKHIEHFAGGLRNSYDIAFNREGELFTYDSDMEWDEGLPWYRATRLLHVVPGGEYGWRSGWAKWPSYFLDNLPPLLETGRGSPTGLEVYDHQKFPAEYQGAMFICDWTLGRVLAIKMQPAHGTYKATSEVFLEGKPLNVTDVTVGPDGWLYFCTGGRGTEGGIYRVVYTGDAPPPRKLAGIGRAIRQPQFYSAYSRDKIASVQEEMGAEWDRQVAGLVSDPKADPQDRARAMDLMHLYGPFPSPKLLLKLSQDKQFEVRAKAAVLLSQHANQEKKETKDRLTARLEEMLADGHPTVRRQACEALIRCQHQPPAESVLPLLTDANRFVVWSARRLLENIPSDAWQKSVLESQVPRIFNHGAVALLSVQSDKPTAQQVLASGTGLMKNFLNDGDFIDLLRVVQLALHRGGIAAEDVAPDLKSLLAKEYPAKTTGNTEGGRRINRELVRLLAYLQEPSAAAHFADQLRSSEPLEEKLHVAFHARFLKVGWTSEQKFELLEFYEKSRKTEGGFSLPGYVENVERDFVSVLTAEEHDTLLRRATSWPTAALGVLMTLPEHPGAEMLDRLTELDRRLRDVEGEPARKLQTGVVAVLARTREERSMAYLREVFENDPSRRMTLAMGLAQSPAGKNWPLLLRSLPILEGAAAAEVLTQLKLVDGGPPRDVEPVRQVILCGLKLKDQGSEHAVALLEHWFNQKLGKPGDRWDVAMKAWQDWFVRKYPNSSAPELPQASQSAWSMEELVLHLNKPETKGDAKRGAQVYVKAQCAKCHRFQSVGEPVGPDLTSVARRFQKREVLESVLFPSQVISDQYASKNVLTEDGKQYTGLVASVGQDVIITQSDGNRVRLPRTAVTRIAPSKLSAMPEGLFNELSLEEITDLFEYLYQTPAERVTRQDKPTKAR
jgi:putative heme-binding domain-containing protein